MHHTRCQLCCCRPLTQQYQQVAKSVFLLSVGAASGGARKKTHGELSDKITGLWRNALLFEKGTVLFPGGCVTLSYFPDSGVRVPHISALC